MQEFHLENQTVVIELLSWYCFLTIFMLVLSSLKHLDYRLEAFLVQSCWVLMLKLILVRVSLCGYYVSFFPCNWGFYILNIISLSFPLVSFLWWFNKYPNMLVLLCRLCKILDFKKVFSLFLSISDSEIEPLLMAFSISVDLHV